MDRHMVTEEIEQAEKLIQSSTLEWFMQMNYVREAFDGYIVCMETKAKGETAESVSDYIEDVHKYLLNQFYSLFAEISGRIVQYVEEIPKELLPSKIMNDYEAAHLTEDFGMMEKMMDELETLIEECRDTSAVQIECYQKGNIRNYGAVWELERLARIRDDRLKENKTALQRAMRAYKERLLRG